MPTEALVQWVKRLEEMGFEIIIVSNSRKNRVTTFAEALGLPCVQFSMKPLKKGMKKAIRIAKKKYKKEETSKFLSKITLEKVLLLGILLGLIGVGLTVYAIIIWKGKSWGELNPVDVMPITIPAVYLIIIGIQVTFTSFIIGILNIEYKRKD